MRAKGITRDNKIILSEQDEHLRFMEYLNAHNILFHHSANEQYIKNEQDKNWLLKKWRMGVKKGFPDFIIFLQDKLICIEMKRADAKPSSVSKHQQAWLEWLNETEYCIAIWAAGTDHAIRLIEEYI